MENGISICIKHYRRQLATINDAHYRVGILVNTVNYCSCPYRLMSEREHRICDRMKKRARKELSLLTGWKETENGYLLTV